MVQLKVDIPEDLHKREIEPLSRGDRRLKIVMLLEQFGGRIKV